MRISNAKKTRSLATHMAQVQSRPFACQTDAEGGIAVSEGRGSGQRGRPATPMDALIFGDAEIVRADRDQTTTVERGFRWMKKPTAIHPVWLEKRERMSALAMLTVVGLLVYGLIQRQVRQYLQEHEQTIPGNKGETESPTATVVFESFATLNRVD